MMIVVFCGARPTKGKERQKKKIAWRKTWRKESLKHKFSNCEVHQCLTSEMPTILPCTASLNMTCNAHYSFTSAEHWSLTDMHSLGAQSASACHQFWTGLNEKCLSTDLGLQVILTCCLVAILNARTCEPLLISIADKSLHAAFFFFSKQCREL